MLTITPSFAVPEDQLVERFVRASGPGGQNVNKVATAAELRFSVPAASLPDDVKARLASLAGRRMNADGVILMDSREHRTQAGNREAARARLAALIRQALRQTQTIPAWIIGYCMLKSSVTFVANFIIIKVWLMNINVN